MTLMLLAILCSTANQLLFKLYARLEIAALPAIVINYLVAFGLGCGLVAGGPPAVGGRLVTLWCLAAFQGGILVGCFLLMSAVTRLHGVAVAAVSARIAVVIPVVVAFLLYDDTLHVAKAVGILMALGTLFLLRPEAGTEGYATKGHALPLALFLGFGFNLAYTKWVQTRFLTPHGFHSYLALCFLWAFVWGLTALRIRRGPRPLFENWRVGLAGAILGLNNYGAIYFLIAALAQPTWESSVIFPIVSVSVVMLSFFSGVLLFGERATVRNIGAVALGAASLIMIHWGPP
ncbi:MAG: hypothetical protein QNJ22_12410 [Desulfosarcinaceae bacterium]|nr:hypothetical protein [Desulfosarcinaceae bacterium]